ncbi:MAG: hypothetical protein AB7O59_07125 [Pirellulales bacterium]
MLHQVTRTAIVVAMLLAVDFVFVAVDPPYRPTMLGALAIGSMAAQVGLCATWLALGRDPAWLQFPAALLVFAGIREFLLRWNARAMDEFAPGYLVQAALVVLVLALMRANRFQLVRNNAAMAPSGAVPQFSIRDILLATAVVAAAVFGLVRLSTMSLNRDTPNITAIVGVFLGGLTLLAVLSTLTTRRYVLASWATCAVGAALGWMIARAIHYDVPTTMVAFGTLTVLQVAVLGAIRVAGKCFRRAAPAWTEGGAKASLGPLT